MAQEHREPRKSAEMPRLKAFSLHEEAAKRLTKAQMDKINQDFMLAIPSGNIEVIQRFIAAGADLNARNGNGETPLMLAAHEGYHAMCKILIDAGSDVNAAPAQSHGVLEHAILGGDNFQTVRVLLEAGADPNPKGARIMPLLWAASSIDKNAICELLLEHGADADARDNDEKTSLMLAAERDNVALCELLIRHGANIALRDKTGRTASMIAKEMMRDYAYKFLRDAELRNILGQDFQAFRHDFAECTGGGK